MMWVAAVVGCGPQVSRGSDKEPLEISGRYPSLAMFNHFGECGTGAVVPWAGKLWVITYAPHQPTGSDDKLYEISPDLKQTIRPESVGGTPAARMIHKESNQLIIGSYVIDAKGGVRAVSMKTMPGRITAIARHLTDPANLVYVYGMEGELYELNVHTLAVNKIFDRAVPGWHGKGMHSSQGVLVVANNGEAVASTRKNTYKAGEDKKGPEDAGVLAQYDGKDWKIIERKQFTDVTTAGGIEGPRTPDAPLWSIGWDKRSVILKLLDKGQWSTFRIPKADYSYDGYHGWHTEWPRIREVTDGKYLMNMHGGWFDFPPTFSAADTSGLRPIGAYAKITGDFAPWNNRIVFGCDDLAQSDFTGNAKAASKFKTQSQSNLWFSSWNDITHLSNAYGNGGIWLNDHIEANQPSVPFLIAGYRDRNIHLWHSESAAAQVKIEIDATGKGDWKVFKSVEAQPGNLTTVILPDNVPGEWLRVSTGGPVAAMNAYCNFGSSAGQVTDEKLFAGLEDASDASMHYGGRLFALGDDSGDLLYQSYKVGSTREFVSCYAVNPSLNFSATTQPSTDYNVGREIELSSDAASIIVTEGKKIFRLPRGSTNLDPTEGHRTVREISTERYLMNTGGTFYILPRSISGGAAHLKPIATHNKRIDDFAPWRGMMVIAGTRADAKSDGHLYKSPDGASLWFGDIDDLWKMGAPKGIGGPWLETAVKAGTPSDPYLMAGYYKKALSITHDAAGPVEFAIEVDVTGNGTWQTHAVITAKNGAATAYQFPEGFNAHWVRLKSSADCKATAQLVYAN